MVICEKSENTSGDYVKTSNNDVKVNDIMYIIMRLMHPAFNFENLFGEFF